MLRAPVSRLLVTAFLSGCGSAAAQPPTGSAALVVTGGRIWTGDPARPEAQALAVGADGRLLAVGTDGDIRALAGPATRVVEAGGRRLVPGLNDSHLHPTRGGHFYTAELRWDGVASLARGLAMVREQAARTPEGQWVRVGRSPAQLDECRLPTPAELTAASPYVPIFVLFLYSRGFVNAAGVLRDYGQRYGADGCLWRLATGEVGEVARLTRSLGVLYAPAAGSGRVPLDHTLATALVGPDGHIARLWHGTDWTTDEVEQAVATVLAPVPPLPAVQL